MYPIRFSKSNFIITLAAGTVIFFLWFLGMPCIFLTLSGIPCPGCGMTRAVLSLLLFRFEDAIYYHPCVFLMPLFYLYFWQNGTVFRNRVLNNIVLILAAALFFLRYIFVIIT